MYPLDHEKLNGLVGHIITTCTAKETKKVIEKTNYISETLSTEYTQQPLTGYSRSFIVCVQRPRTIPYDDDKESEKHA